MTSLTTLVFCIAFWASFAHGAEPAAQQTLTVATFNINWGNPDLPGVANVISRSQADLVALQETNDRSARYLSG